MLVTITDKQVDVIVNDAEMDETKKAQIENVVKRKTGIAAKNITITPNKQPIRKAATIWCGVNIKIII